MSEEPQKRSLFGRLFGRGPKPVEAQPPVEEKAEVVQPGREPADEAVSSKASEPPIAVAVQPVVDVVEAAVPPPEAERLPEPAPDPVAPPPKLSWFQRLTAGLKMTSSKLTEGITSVFTKRKLDASTLEELEDLLIQADLGLETSTRITQALAKGRFDKSIDPEEVKAILAAEVAKVLEPVAKPLEIKQQHKPHVVLVVGVNGTGKTTTIGKYAKQYVGQGLKVMLAAGDTFRAAAIDGSDSRIVRSMKSGHPGSMA